MKSDNTGTAQMALSPDLLRKLDAYWRAANYLSVGQIYLYDNPLLRVPLKLEHVKPRLLGHWGTTPGLNFIYAHMNRVIRREGLDALYVTGPGHGEHSVPSMDAARSSQPPRPESTTGWKSAALSLVTSSVPVSIFDGVIPYFAFMYRLTTER